MTTNLLMPNLSKLDEKELEALSKLIAEQEYLIDANGYLAFARVIKSVDDVLADYSFSSPDAMKSIKETIADSIDDIRTIEHIGMMVAEIVAGFSIPTQCVEEYLSKYGEFQHD